jgi:hypothetical protein
MVADRRNGALALILLAGWINLKVFLFGPLTIYVTNAEEMQVGFHSLVFLYLIPFLVSGAILIVLDGFQSDVFASSRRTMAAACRFSCKTAQVSGSTAGNPACG